MSVQKDGRPRELIEYEREIVAFFVDAAAILGVPKSVVAIYGVVFASPEPISFSTIEERLGISRGSVSQGLHVLREFGALKTVPFGDGRREFFVPDMELRHLIGRFLKNRLQVHLSAGKVRLATIRKNIPSADPSEAEVLRGRVMQLQRWHNRTYALLPIARTFLKLTPV